MVYLHFTTFTVQLGLPPGSEDMSRTLHTLKSSNDQPCMDVMYPNDVNPFVDREGRPPAAGSASKFTRNKYVILYRQTDYPRRGLRVILANFLSQPCSTITNTKRRVSKLYLTASQHTEQRVNP